MNNACVAVEVYDDVSPYIKIMKGIMVIISVLLPMMHGLVLYCQ